MPIAIEEYQGGMSVSGGQFSRKYRLYNTTATDSAMTESLCITAILAGVAAFTIPNQINNNVLDIDRTELEEQAAADSVSTCSFFNGKLYWVFPKLVSNPTPPSGLVTPAQQATWNFSFSAATRHITQCGEVSRFSWDNTNDPVPDSKGLIGFDGESVRGLDVEYGVLDFTVSVTADPSVFSATLGAYIASLVEHTNDATYLGYPAGELRLRGVDVTQAGEDNPTVNAKFSIRTNKTGVIVGGTYDASANTYSGGITVGDVGGWEELDIRYKDSIVTSGTCSVHMSTPRFVYVKRPYTPADYTPLNAMLGI